MILLVIVKLFLKEKKMAEEIDLSKLSEGEIMELVSAMALLMKGARL